MQRFLRRQLGFLLLLQDFLGELFEFLSADLAVSQGLRDRLRRADLGDQGLHNFNALCATRLGDGRLKLSLECRSRFTPN